VPHGDEIIPIINKLIDEHKWATIVATQDFHPVGHISFASTHDRKPLEKITISFQGEQQEQVLWPEHCIQGTRGCEIHHDLKHDAIAKVFQYVA
jgi:nicotinamidase/pyrazinamidase